MSIQAIVTILVLFQGSYAGSVFRQIASLISFLHEQMKPLPCQQDYFVTGTHLLTDKGAEAFLATGSISVSGDTQLHLEAGKASSPHWY